MSREQVIAQAIERWMRSDGFAHRYAAEILRGEDTTPLAAADCAYFVELDLQRAES